MIDLFTSIPKVREYDADERAAMGMFPRNPICQRCNREATFLNPVGITRRDSWSPFNKQWGYRTLDAICAECRERYRG
jgi:hypothetical protein